MAATILAIDTATNACSAALQIDDKIYTRNSNEPQSHASLLLLMVKQLLSEANIMLADVAAIAFSCGPGSFTGLRIGAGVVQGLAFAANLPVISISTLQILAQSAYRNYQAEAVLCALDARMKEVYWGSYSLHKPDGLMLAVGADCVCAPDKVLFPESPINKWYGVGPGWQAYDNVLCHKAVLAVQPSLLPSAQDALPLAQQKLLVGQLHSAQQTVPMYLRDQVAKHGHC